MNEFERMIEEARRNAEATASQQQAAQMREEAERAEHQERLRQILRVTPLLADVLTNKPAPTDIELMLRRWQEARKGLRRSTSGRWVEEPYGSGWTVTQDIAHYSTEGNRSQGIYYGVRGVLLGPDGTVFGYKSTVDSFIINRLRRERRFTVDKSTVGPLTVGGVKVLTPEEPWPNRPSGFVPRYYFLPYGEYNGHFTLEDILNGLATLAAKHGIEPSVFSGE